MRGDGVSEKDQEPMVYLESLKSNRKEVMLNVDLSYLADRLPPMIARDQVERLLGGVISAKYLANLDSLGQGPDRYRIGRKIVYPTAQLLMWLSKRTTMLS